jgi:hypothetical protein
VCAAELVSAAAQVSEGARIQRHIVLGMLKVSKMEIKRVQNGCKKGAKRV